MKPSALTKDQALILLAFLGKDLARFATPSYYRHEDRDRAAPYVSQVVAARTAYRAVRDARGTSDILEALHELKRHVAGIERNFLNLIISGILGQPHALNHTAIIERLKAHEEGRHYV